VRKILVDEQNQQISYGLHVRGIQMNTPLAAPEKFATGNDEQLL
jgi:hypothetical protein